MLPVFVILRRFVRAMVAAWRSDAEFRVLVFLVVSILVSGTTFYSFAEKWSVVDAFYFSVTTLTTVGFGDPAPTTTVGKLFTVLYIFVGIGVIGGFISVMAKNTLALRRRRAGDGEGQEDAPPARRRNSTNFREPIFRELDFSHLQAKGIDTPLTPIAQQR